MRITIPHVGLARRIVSEAVITSPTGESVTIPALWDTGATCSAITVDTAQRLNLRETVFRTCRHAGGVSRVIMCEATVVIQDDLKIGKIELMTSPNVPGMLIGMDIIARGRFCIDSENGNTVFTFDFENSNYAKET